MSSWESKSTIWIFFFAYFIQWSRRYITDQHIVHGGDWLFTLYDVWPFYQQLKQLNVLGEGLDVVIKPSQESLDQMIEFVRSMHEKSGLLDELLTSDDYLSRAADGAKIYELEYKRKKPVSEKIFGPAAKLFLSE